MSNTDRLPTQPAQRGASLLAEREDYIHHQEQLRAERTETVLYMLLSMIDERAVEDSHLVRQIQDAHIGEDGLPSFDALSDDWQRIVRDRAAPYHQQRVEIDLARCVLDTDQTVRATSLWRSSRCAGCEERHAMG